MLVVNGQIRESLFGTVRSLFNLILHNRVLQVSQVTATMCKGRNLIGIRIYVYVYVRTYILLRFTRRTSIRVFLLVVTLSENDVISD